MYSVSKLRTSKALIYYSYEIVLVFCAAVQRKEGNWCCQPLLMIIVASTVRHTWKVNIREKVNEALCTKYPSEKVLEPIEKL